MRTMQMAVVAMALIGCREAGPSVAVNVVVNEGDVFVFVEPDECAVDTDSDASAEDTDAAETTETDEPDEGVVPPEVPCSTASVWTGGLEVAGALAVTPAYGSTEWWISPDEILTLPLNLEAKCGEVEVLMVLIRSTSSDEAFAYGLSDAYDDEGEATLSYEGTAWTQAAADASATYLRADGSLRYYEAQYSWADEDFLPNGVIQDMRVPADDAPHMLQFQMPRVMSVLPADGADFHMMVWWRDPVSGYDFQTTITYSIGLW